jgi:threonine aldolase
VLPRRYLAEALDLAKKKDLSTHLDGARVFNAGTELQMKVKDLCAGFDSVSACLSKGLGAPAGTVLLGRKEFVQKAKRSRKILGGAMRQAGVIAAAALWALDHHVERLADDHSNARWLAEGLVEAGMPVRLEQVETNFVQLDAGALGLDADEAVARLRAEGVLLSFAARHGVLRAVTHLDVSAEQVEEAVQAIPRALTGAAPTAQLAADAPTPF